MRIALLAHFGMNVIVLTSEMKKSRAQHVKHQREDLADHIMTVTFVEWQSLRLAAERYSRPWKHKTSIIPLLHRLAVKCTIQEGTQDVELQEEQTQTCGGSVRMRVCMQTNLSILDNNHIHAGRKVNEII